MSRLGGEFNSSWPGWMPHGLGARDVGRGELGNNNEGGHGNGGEGGKGTRSTKVLTA